MIRKEILEKEIADKMAELSKLNEVESAIIPLSIHFLNKIKCYK